MRLGAEPRRNQSARIYTWGFRCHPPCGMDFEEICRNLVHDPTLKKQVW